MFKTHRLFGTTDFLFWCSINATADTVPGLELIDSISLMMHTAKATLRKRVLRIPDRALLNRQISCRLPVYGKAGGKSTSGTILGLVERGPNTERPDEIILKCKIPITTKIDKLKIHKMLPFKRCYID